MPRATAAATAAAAARWAALMPGPSPPRIVQLLLSTCGFSAAPALKPPVVLTKLVLTIVKSTSGAAANALADSPVP
jgi:hypothetical protein